MDAREWYRNPTRTIAGYDRVLRDLDRGRSAFVIGEVQFGDDPRQWAEWTRYEAALNRVLLNLATNAIKFTNTGSVAARLISRHWVITDANNQVQEVRGLGVVGEQPLLKPGESYEYTSGSAIATPVGTMKGSYQMVAEDGTKFDAPIPEFTLSIPRVLH